MQQHDYTKGRTGRRIAGGRIELCPKCGRKGLKQRCVPEFGAPYTKYTHVIREDQRGFLAMVYEDDACEIES